MTPLRTLTGAITAARLAGVLLLRGDWCMVALVEAELQAARLTSQLRSRQGVLSVRLAYEALDSLLQSINTHLTSVRGLLAAAQQRSFRTGGGGGGGGVSTAAGPVKSRAGSYSVGREQAVGIAVALDTVVHCLVYHDLTCGWSTTTTTTSGGSKSGSSGAGSVSSSPSVSGRL